MCNYFNYSQVAVIFLLFSFSEHFLFWHQLVYYSSAEFIELDLGLLVFDFSLFSDLNYWCWECIYKCHIHNFSPEDQSLRIFEFFCCRETHDRKRVSYTI